MTQPLRIGLIGAGMVSRHHLSPGRVYQIKLASWRSPIPPAKTPRGARANSALRKPSPDAEAMLAETELDAVDIAAPREMHAPLVRLAAAKRLPVLCQKPLAPNLQEATELAAEVEGLTRLMVHENWRFRGYYRDAAAWLREGRIGNVKQAQLTLLTSGVLPGPDGLCPALERQPFMRRRTAHAGRGGPDPSSRYAAHAARAAARDRGAPLPFQRSPCRRRRRGDPACDRQRRGRCGLCKLRRPRPSGRAGRSAGNSRRQGGDQTRRAIAGVFGRIARRAHL